MSSEIHEGPLEPAAEPRPSPKLSWREKRWERRRRRRRTEELLGWIFVPLIVLACYWLVVTILDGLGTSPSAIVAGIRQVLSGGGPVQP